MYHFCHRRLGLVGAKRLGGFTFRNLQQHDLRHLYRTIRGYRQTSNRSRRLGDYACSPVQTAGSFLAGFGSPGSLSCPRASLSGAQRHNDCALQTDATVFWQTLRTIQSLDSQKHSRAVKHVRRRQTSAAITRSMSFNQYHKCTEFSSRKVPVYSRIAELYARLVTHVRTFAFAGSTYTGAAGRVSSCAHIHPAGLE
ncbi:hypothetical protein M3J09_003603 [Ascochyta lentis]